MRHITEEHSLSAKLSLVNFGHKPAARNHPLQSIYFCQTSVFDLGHDVLFLFLLRSQLFIWQAHNALFMIRCLLKVFIREMSEEELHLQFSYQERAPGSCGGELPDWFGKERCATGRLKWAQKCIKKAAPKDSAELEYTPLILFIQSEEQLCCLRQKMKIILVTGEFEHLCVHY